MPSACDSLIEDIEDMVSSSDPTPHERQSARKSIIPRSRKKKEILDNEELQADSLIPGTQKIWMKTWGCSHNNSDGEYMAGQLAVSGYKITDDPSEADLWLLNSCTVKNPAEDHFRNSIKKAQEQQKKVVVAGCVPQAQPRMDYLKGLSIIGWYKVVTVCNWCLNACTYCKTKHARGDLASYPIEELVERARQSFQEGVCEIWLTSEDTGAYGRDIGTDLPTLLWSLVEVIPEGAMLRLGMTNPPYILEHLEEMAKILNHPHVYAFLHVPVQSASDSVLMDMKREYCIDDFKRVVDFLKERVPGVTIATDIICGFPGETEEDFQETVDLVKCYRFPSLFINQFYPRPGTPAAKMEQVPAQVKKQRTKELSQLFHSYNPYDHKVGERQHVLVTEESFDAQYYVAHNKFYEQVLVPKRSEFKGKMIEVDIYEAGKHFLKGQPVEDSKPFTPSITAPLQKGEVSGLMQEQMANGIQDSASMSSSPVWFIGSYSLDREVLKKLGVGLALAAALLAFIVEKLY
ncbi:hypothetical protein PAMP_002353 [Pampus punctatissimus]